MKEIVDIAIIGGGPAGTCAAIAAIKEGATNVLIIEKEPYGRHRIGEILLTQTIIELNNLGIAQEIRDFADKYEWEENLRQHMSMEITVLLGKCKIIILCQVMMTNLIFLDVL